MKKTLYTLNLQERMRILIIFSIAMVLAVGVFGFWQFNQFQSQNLHINKSSLELQGNLQQNFNASRILGNIHTNLRLYMQSADANVLVSIRSDAQTLGSTLPDDMLGDLSHLIKIVDVLAVRMESLQKNNKQIPEAEQAISEALQEIQKNVSPVIFAQIYPISNETMLKHQQLYVSSIISGQVKQIESGQQQITQILDYIDQKLNSIMEQLPADQQKHIRQLQNGFYWLDEASTTVGAIRVTTLETEQDIVSTVDNLKIALAHDSLNRNKKSFSLMEEGLGMAKKNILFLVVSLCVLVCLFIFTSLVISKHMIRPLVDFVSLLRGLGQMMAGQRTQCSTDDENLGQLSSFIKNRQDEIGEVARAIKEMLIRLQNISFFRQTIEADESTSEIYARLARILTLKLGFDKFVIYEKLRGQESMKHVYCQPPELGDELPEFSMSDNCRAKRTGAIVNSYEDPAICTMYPFPDCMDHYCIPMLVGGHVIGVVQLLFSKSMPREEKAKLADSINEARNFIAETLPVLQSKHLATELEEMATKDQLTGLFNRRYLETSLDVMVAGIKRRGTSLGILMCDLDFFKQVNDALGHDGGDAILRQMAQVLMNSVRSADMVIRFGGEEFIILLLDCQNTKAHDVAENIRRAVEGYKFHYSGQTVQKTVSIGVAEFPTSDHQGIWEAIKQADVALYKAKDNGRNRVEIFTEEMWKESSY